MQTVILRSITGVVLVAVVWAWLFHLPAVMAGYALAVLMGWAALEWCAVSGIRLPSWCGLLYVGVVLAVAVAFYLASSGVYLAYGVTLSYLLLCCPLWQWSRCQHVYQAARYGYVGLVWGLMVLSSCALTLQYFYRVSPWLLLMLLSLVWVADSGAYFVGRCFGRRKLLPAVSPKKTVEGAVGGLVLVALVAMLWHQSGLYPLGSLLTWVILAVLASVLSIIGDLAESAMKRRSGIKDSGALLPGHGGILDRLDGVFAALPFWWVACDLLHVIHGA